MYNLKVLSTSFDRLPTHFTIIFNSSGVNFSEYGVIATI